MLPSSPAPQRKCLGCPKKLTGARTNQIYCGKKCRGREWARANRRQSMTITATDFAALLTEILRVAVGLSDIAGYSLSCWCPNRPQAGEVRFPQPTRKTKRFPSPDGRFRFTRSAYFRLAPFEPPRVPIEGEYRLRFHREDGSEIVISQKLRVTVDAAFPSVRFYDSQGNDFDPKGNPIKPRPKKRKQDAESSPASAPMAPQTAPRTPPSPAPRAVPVKRPDGLRSTRPEEPPAATRSPLAALSPTRLSRSALHKRREPPLVRPSSHASSS